MLGSRVQGFGVLGFWGLDCTVYGFLGFRVKGFGLRF